jgi:O-antigen ligase
MTSALPVSSVVAHTPAANAEIGREHRIARLGIVGLLLLAPLAFGTTEPWSQFVLEFGSACLFVLWVMREAQSTVFSFRWVPSLTPMLAFGLLVALQLAFHLTASTERTVTAALLFAAYFMICFLLAQSLRRPQQLEWAARLASAYGIAFAIFALVQGITSNGKLYWLRKPYYEGWIYGPYVNHNHYAGLMEMLTPIPLVIALSPRCSLRNRWLASTAAAIMATSILFSQSRGGIVGFAAELLLLTILLARHGKRRKTLVTLIGFLCLIALVATWLGASQIIDRMGTLHSQAQAEISGGMRLSIDRDVLRMFPHKPFLGWGLGSFVDVYPQFRSFYTNLVIDHAHNDYLELLVETGIAGAIVAVWLLSTVFRSAWKKLQSREWGIIELATAASTAGITGILIHSLVDFNLQIPANAALLYVLCTIAAMRIEPACSTPHGER